MRRGFLALLILLASASAWAQAPDLDRARRHFEAGSQAFQRGDYPRAELEFRGAYAITKDPLLFYNIGQSQQRRGHQEAAIKSYRSYLAGVPDADDRAEVEGIIRSIEKEMTAPKPGGGGGVVTGPGEKPPRGPTSRSEDDSRARRQSAWIVGSVSVAMLAVGAAMSGLSWKRAVDANKMINRRDAFGQPVPFVDVQTAFNAKKSDAATFGGVAIGMYAAAAVGIGISTYLFISSRSGKASKEKREARLRLVPVLDYHNAGLVAGMEF
jgi:tetratricopeptide (TPR) repeat protein